MNDLKFFTRGEPVKITRRLLPHWEQPGCACAITFRLADSLPRHLLDAWDQERSIWLSHHPRPWTEKIEQEYHHRFSDRMHEWLDAGHGSCILRDHRLAELVAAQIQSTQASGRCALWAFVVMPNHVHVLVSLGDNCPLSRLIGLWKGGSARRINLASTHKGRLWQPDYFDRLVRSPNHFERCLDYIRDNPANARLPTDAVVWWENPKARVRLRDYLSIYGAL